MSPRVYWVVGLVCLCIGACGINRRYANQAVRNLDFREVTLAYQTSDALTDSGAKVLTIEYPHPRPSLAKSFALVQLRTTTDSSFSLRQVAGGAIDADPIAEFHLPKYEFEYLMENLIADGFFDTGDRPGGVTIKAQIGSRAIEKQWDRVSEFDALAGRISAAETVGGSNAQLIPEILPADEVEQSSLELPSDPPKRTYF